LSRRAARVAGIIVILLCGVFPAEIDAQTASAVFHLDVQRSKVLPLGKSSLATRSAFVTYTNEFFGGRTNALKIQFFIQPIGPDAQARLLRDDTLEMTRGGYAALVLFLDERHQIQQVNLTYVIPGTTVVRTVASTREELARYFSDYQFANNRLRLKSKGSHRTAPDSKDDDAVTLSWDTDLNVPVFDRRKN
jgi:hypothetical protein